MNDEVDDDDDDDQCVCQVCGVRGPDKRPRRAQPGHERARVSPPVGQSLDRIQLRHGERREICLVTCSSMCFYLSTRQQEQREGGRRCPAPAPVCRTSGPLPSLSATAPGEPATTSPTSSPSGSPPSRTGRCSPGLSLRH